jgi:hypothetical protein
VKKDYIIQKEKAVIRVKAIGNIQRHKRSILKARPKVSSLPAKLLVRITSANARKLIIVTAVINKSRRVKYEIFGKNSDKENLKAKRVSIVVEATAIYAPI